MHEDHNSRIHDMKEISWKKVIKNDAIHIIQVGAQVESYWQSCSTADTIWGGCTTVHSSSVPSVPTYGVGTYSCSTADKIWGGCTTVQSSSVPTYGVGTSCEYKHIMSASKYSQKFSTIATLRLAQCH